MLQFYYIVDEFKTRLKKSGLILALLLPLGLILAGGAQAEYRTDSYPGQVSDLGLPHLWGLADLLYGIFDRELQRLVSLLHEADEGGLVVRLH